MRTPASVIRPLVARNFPVRGQATFCLTESQFEARWTRLVSDIRTAGLPSQLLEPTRARLESMWVRVVDASDEAKTDRIRQWPQEPARKLAIKPAKPAPKPVVLSDDKATWDEVIQAIQENHKLDGYQMFRHPPEYKHARIGGSQR
jgi:hypothetical protein